jgi:hypothetical protein
VVSVGQIFDQDIGDEEIATLLARMSFSKIAQAHSAHVFGDSENLVVIKVFPGVSVGPARNLTFIQRNASLRVANRMSLYWSNVTLVKWLRHQAKIQLAKTLSRQNDEHDCQLSIDGYKACITNGLMTELPTRVIPNCLSQLKCSDRKSVPEYLLKPNEIVVQERFTESDVVLKQLQIMARSENADVACESLIRQVVEYQKSMWQMGLISTDLSFNVFENLILLPNGEVQLHDANDVAVSLKEAKWFIREKETDMNSIFEKIENGGFPSLLFDANFATVAESARKLYQVLPRTIRESLVLLYLSLARITLCEQTFQANWKVSLK